MVKRKQKVRWNKLGGLDWSCDEQAGTSNEAPGKAVKRLSVPGPCGRTRGSSGQTRSSVLAPRFQRKAAEEAEQKKIYYEGDLCETVDLPNGFAKIRSKNLDILFKRDFYEQKMAAEFEALLKLKNLETSEEVCYEAFVEKQSEEFDVFEFELASTNKSVGKSDNFAKFSSFDQMDLNLIPEFKPLNSCIETSVYDSSHFSQFQSSTPHSQEYLADQYPVKPRPTLYLYSPVNNTFIPCEEIVIPNQVKTTDGPVYSGSSNMYLAYPVHGPEGVGYITQPFNSSDSFHSQDMSNSSLSMSFSGQDSGFSTQPASPLPTVNYNPTNYGNEDVIHEVPPSTEGYYNPPTTVDKFTTKPTNPDPSQFNITVPDSVALSTKVNQIPGLPSDSLTTRRKRSKRGRKKKFKPEPKNQTDSTSSDSEVLKFPFTEDSTSLKVDNNDVSLEDDFEEFIPLSTDEKELNLTDDLADSLLNPPTDPEVSEAELRKLKYSTNAQNYLHDGGKKENYSAFCELVKHTLVKDLLNNVEFENEAVNEDSNAVELSLFNRSVSGVLFDLNPTNPSEKETIELKKVVECVNLQERSEDLVKCIKTKYVEECLNIKQKDCNDDVSLEKYSHEEMKESYSSIIKASLVTVSDYNSTCSQDHVKTCTNLDPLESITSCPPDYEMVEQESELCWEKVPLSVSSPEKWENMSKKRKHKKKSDKFEDYPFGMQVLELAQEAALDVLDILDKKLVSKEAVIEEEFVKTEEMNQEKRKRRKRKKSKSERHRVVICDEQISVKYSQDVIQVSEVLSSSMLDIVKTLVVQDLGFGISRGCMNFGRLYRGNYVPPERTDGIFPENACQEEEVIEEEIGGEVFDQGFLT